MLMKKRSKRLSPHLLGPKCPNPQQSPPNEPTFHQRQQLNNESASIQPSTESVSLSLMSCCKNTLSLPEGCEEERGGGSQTEATFIVKNSFHC